MRNKIQFPASTMVVGVSQRIPSPRRRSPGLPLVEHSTKGNSTRNPQLLIVAAATRNEILGPKRFAIPINQRVPRSASHWNIWASYPSGSVCNIRGLHSAVNVLLSRYTLNRGAYSRGTMSVKIARKSRGRRDKAQEVHHSLRVGLAMQICTTAEHNWPTLCVR